MNRRSFNLSLAASVASFFAAAYASPATAATSLKPGLNRLTFQSEGVRLAANLYLPEGYKPADGRLPAIVISGPWTQVKEQVGATYGPRLAQAGFAVLTFDPRYWGKSGGEPRFFESTAKKATDIVNAVTFLSSFDVVDPKRIGAIGVCAGFGNVSLAAGRDPRIAAIAGISPWIQHPSTTPLFYSGPEGVAQRIKKAEAALAAFKRTGTMPVVDAYNPTNPEAAMFFPVDYYGKAQRGAVPQWSNRFAVASWKEWLELDSVAFARNVKVPVKIVYGDKTFLPQNITAYYELLPGKKSIEQIVGEHTEFYDLSGSGEVKASVAKVAAHFKSVM